jgi:hypothetical protein
LLLASNYSTQCCGKIKARLIPRSDELLPSVMPDATLEAIRLGNPCGRSLTLLHALATETKCCVHLEASRGQLLEVEVLPCPA